MVLVLGQGHPEGVAGGGTAPIIVHRPSAVGGRRVTVRTRGYDEFLGTAYSDHDLIVFLEASGVTDPESKLDDPLWVEWSGGPAHQWSAA
ncbi:hypothetical protein [Streptomyces sp. NPDC001222]|uniref:hypothetical protein n=1 Tax=Streptomyces sp. NPDC001222 TaxID=3364548 RepID=UPI00369EC74A